jgi:hypothetical protein
MPYSPVKYIIGALLKKFPVFFYFRKIGKIFGRKTCSLRLAILMGA